MRVDNHAVAALKSSCVTKLMALSVFLFSGQDEKCFENEIRLPKVISHMVLCLVLKGLIELRPVVGKM